MTSTSVVYLGKRLAFFVLALACTICPDPGGATPPNQSGSNWKVVRSAEWVHFRPVPNGNDRREYFIRQTATGTPEVYTLDYYRPSKLWKMRPYLRAASASELAMINTDGVKATPTTGRAAPFTGLFIYRNGWPQLGPRDVRKSGPLPLPHYQLDFTYAENHHLKMLSSTRRPAILLVYRGGCIACDDDLTPFTIQAKHFVDRTHGQAFVVAMADPGRIRRQIAAMPGGSAVTVVGGRSNSLTTALNLMTMPRTYVIDAQGAARGVIVGSTPQSLLDAYLSQFRM